MAKAQKEQTWELQEEEEGEMEISPRLTWRGGTRRTSAGAGRRTQHEEPRLPKQAGAPKSPLRSHAVSMS